VPDAKRLVHNNVYPVARRPGSRGSRIWLADPSPDLEPCGCTGRWWSLTPPFHPYPDGAVCFLLHLPAGQPGPTLPARCRRARLELVGVGQVRLKPGVDPLAREDQRGTVVHLPGGAWGIGGHDGRTPQPPVRVVVALAGSANSSYTPATDSTSSPGGCRAAACVLDRPHPRPASARRSRPSAQPGALSQGVPVRRVLGQALHPSVDHLRTGVDLFREEGTRPQRTSFKIRCGAALVLSTLDDRRDLLRGCHVVGEPAAVDRERSRCTARSGPTARQRIPSVHTSERSSLARGWPQVSPPTVATGADSRPGLGPRTGGEGRCRYAVA
jgi:hypothetical protein